MAYKEEVDKPLLRTRVLRMLFGNELELSSSLASFARPPLSFILLDLPLACLLRLSMELVLSTRGVLDEA